MSNRTANVVHDDGPYVSQAHGCYVESEWRRSAARRAVDHLYGRYERPKPAQSSRRALLVIAAAAVGVLALVAAERASGAELVVHGVSQHFNKTDWAEYNEVNPGLGVRWQRSDTVALQVGAYKNTQGRGSAYALADWMPLRAGRFSAGAFAGIASGYAEHYEDKRRSSAQAIPAAGLTARAQVDRVAVVLRGAPPIKDKSAGVVALELAVRL